MQNFPWKGFIMSGWHFDGRELKSSHHPSHNHTYIWNGKELSPKSGPKTQRTWCWDGKYIYPKFGKNIQNTWVIHNHTLRPAVFAFNRTSYNILGAPVPIIIGFLMGLYEETPNPSQK
jgi:hypothetical protein